MPRLQFPKVETKVHHLVPHSFHLLGEDMPSVRVAVEERISATAGPRDFTAQGPMLASRLIKLIDVRVANLSSHLLFVHPGLVKESAEIIPPAYGHIGQEIMVNAIENRITQGPP